MKGFKQDQYGVFHPAELPDYPATHAAGAPKPPPPKTPPGKAPPKPQVKLRPPNKPNRPTGRASIAGVGHKKTKPNFRPVKANVRPAPPKVQHPPPLHKTTTQAKHTGVTPPGHAPPQKRAMGPSLGGGPCPLTYIPPWGPNQGQTMPTHYQDASGNPLDSAPWAPGSPYENAVFVDLDGSQWVGQISIYDGSFTTLEQGYRPGQPSGQFNNPVAGLTNGHAYLYPPIQPGVTIPPGGYYSDLIKVQTDLGVFSGGLPAGSVASTSTTGVTTPYAGDGGITQATDGGYTGDGGQQYMGTPGDGGMLPGDGGAAMGALGSVISTPGDGGYAQAPVGGYATPAPVAPGDGGYGLPAVAPAAVQTLSGVAAPAPVATPSGVAAPAGGIDPSTLQSLLQQAAAMGAAQATQGQGDGGNGDGGDGGDGG